MAEEQQNSDQSNGGNVIPTPEEVATFLHKTVEEGTRRRCDGKS
jgi:hypothetical protein